MGSSCFCRGNNRNIEVVQDLAARTDLPVPIEARGHLCQNLCKHGPNIVIDETAYREADPVTVVAALNGALQKARAARVGGEGP
jgi:NADH:ubiquinone oxidoreductase subunit E